MGETMEFITILTTVERDLAGPISEKILATRAGACVQTLGPITSRYHWKGGIEAAEEYILLVKTTRDKFAEVEQVIRELHTYEIPEIIALPVLEGYLPYLDWIRRETG